MTGGRYDALGWALFAVSGVFFVIIAIRDGDALVLSSAVAWLLGVGAFAMSRWGPGGR